MRAATLAVCLFALLVNSAPSAGQELGRLFLTPEQRAALDARRKARIPDKPAAVVVESPTTRLDGYVKRLGGRSTVWLNGVAAPEGSQPEGMQVRPGRSDPGSISLTLGEAQRRYELKVGQKLDRGSGEVRDVIDDGAIRVGRPRPPKR